MLLCSFFFFFKQKTAYEMRISDGSSDVCSSDLLDGATDWQAALDGVDAVVHCAARVHVRRETKADPMAAFRRINVVATRHLAQQARAAGVQRFVFLSRSEEHTSELQSLMRLSYAVFCLNKKKPQNRDNNI